MVTQLKPCIAVDWLQCTVKMPQRNFDELFNPFRSEMVKDGTDFSVMLCINERLAELNDKYQLERTGIQTRNFKTIYEIKDRKTGEDIAVIACEPRSVMCMNEDTGLIKIINKYLYQKNFSRWVRKLFADLRLTFMNITRLDIAYDFERFDTMECMDFIRRIKSETYLKTIKSEQEKLMGSSVSVDKGKKTGGTSSVKYGKETSDISYYLYNKTKEMSDVKEKPWIMDHWRANGWTGETEVFRLEFSLRPDTKGIPVFVIDGDTGELRIDEVLHFKSLDMLDNIDKVFQYHFNKHFNFVRAAKTAKGNWKKQSRCKPVVLFKNLTFESVKIQLSDKKDSGRADKIFAKKLMELNRDLRGTEWDLAIAGNELMTMHIVTHDLQTWAAKKMPEINYSARVMDIISKSRNARQSMDIMKVKQDARVTKDRRQQMEDLLQVEMTIRQKHMAVAPDGKIASYDSTGALVSFIEPIF